MSREYNMQCVYLFYPVLKQHVQYQFEPCDGDTIDHISADHGGVVTILSQAAKRWATRIIRETNNIRENTRILQVFQALRESGQKVKFKINIILLHNFYVINILQLNLCIRH